MTITIRAGSQPRKLADAYPAATCTFTNDLPASYGVDIVQVACKFIYDDGTNDDKSASVDISAGGQVTLTADNTGCCRQYVALSTARRRVDGKEWSFVNPATVDDGYCGGQLIVHLGTKSDAEVGGIDDLFQTSP